MFEPTHSALPLTHSLFPTGIATNAGVVDRQHSATVFLATLPHLVIVNAGDGFDRLFGYARHEAIGQSLFDLDLRLDPRQGAELMAALRARRAARAIEFDIYRKDGERRTVFASMQQTHVDGEPHVLIHAYDASAPLRPIESSRTDMERFEAAFEHASIGMGVVAPDGRWLHVNRALCHLVGYQRSELLTTTFQQITHSDMVCVSGQKRMRFQSWSSVSSTNLSSRPRWGQRRASANR